MDFCGFTIFNYFTTEPVRIAVFLNEFLRTQFRTDFFNPLIDSFDRICYIGNMLLEVFIVQQVIFRKIIKGSGSFFQIIEFCPSFKSFPIAGSDIRGNIDIQSSFSGQMLWCFCFITVFLQTDTDIFFRIITSQRFHISEIFSVLVHGKKDAFPAGFHILPVAFSAEIHHS